MKFTASLYMVCVDYHGGQGSRGYRLQCRLRRRIIRHNRYHICDCYAWANTICDSSAYYTIVRKWGNKL